MGRGAAAEEEGAPGGIGGSVGGEVVEQGAALGQYLASLPNHS